jgi:hypothetical protein
MGRSAYPLGKLQLIVLDDACVTWSMIPKSGGRFSEKIMLKRKIVAGARANCHRWGKRTFCAPFGGILRAQ